jgi:tripartite-type tricarboxylate transporter receptor subunit TctC
MKKMCCLVLLISWTSELWAQSPFYQGKTVTMVAVASAGSLYDLYARLVAQFIGKHIPGNPNFMVQNMPGAGSIIGAPTIFITSPNPMGSPSERCSHRSISTRFKSSPK